MPSEFVVHFTRSLELTTSRPISPADSPLPRSQSHPLDFESAPASNKPGLHALLVSLNQKAVSVDDIHQCLPSLQTLLGSRTGINIQSTETSGEGPLDPEEAALEKAIISKLAISLYSNALEAIITQATEVEAEAEWWSEVQSSYLHVGVYLLQTLPIRIYNVIGTILQTLRAHGLPLNFSTLSPSSLSTLLTSSSPFSLRPGPLTTAFFPHLKHQPILSLSVLLPSPSSSGFRAQTSKDDTFGRFRKIQQDIAGCASMTLQFFNLPLELTKHECRYNQKELEKIRDDRASILGELAQLRVRFSGLVNGKAGLKTNTLATKQYTSLLDTLIDIVQPGSSYELSSTSDNPVSALSVLTQSLSTLDADHTQLLQTRNLLRPSTLTRTWPRLLLFPAVALYVYSSRTSWIPAIVDMVKDTEDTITGFVRGWLVEPLLGVLHTVRAGGKGEVLVTEEGVLADLESLERMTLSLAQDALHYTPSQLEALAQQVRMGDLTPVMQAYEEDIRTPLRSALTGTLLRNAFIQVQKAKVDIDQALAGIDRLLKSQELTFAFVGVAPSLAIVWALLGGVGRLWHGSKGQGRYGGKSKRRGVWERMRRIERILVLQPSNPSGVDSPIAPLPTGLLILSLTRLRSYALAYLPNHIRAHFLEDLGDLEDTQLDREAKLRVVERMWRCWGTGGESIIGY